MKYIHDMCILHTDLKQDNILLLPGKVFLADFGVSADRNKKTITNTRRSSHVIGPEYSAPEQLPLKIQEPFRISPSGCRLG